MPSYGGGTNPALYDGSSGSDPTAIDLLHQIIGFFGMNGPEGPTDDPLYRLQSTFARVFGLPQVLTGSTQMNRELFTQELQWLHGGYVDPQSYVNLGFTVLDWAKSLHLATVGSSTPNGIPVGGGNSVYGVVEDVQAQYDETPVWYTAPVVPTASQNASAVLGYMISHEEGQSATVSEPFANLLSWIGTVLSRMIEFNGFTWPWLPDFVVLPYSPSRWYTHSNGAWGLTESITNYPPPIDASLWADDDTYLSYLQREQPTWGWSTVDPTGTNNPDGFAWTYRVFSSFYRVYFRTIGRANGPRGISAGSIGGGTATDPRYPGADAVTWGTPFDVTASSTVTVDCSGALVEITATGPGQGKQPSGDHFRYPYAGWLSFVGAGGEVDELQRIEFDNSVMMPHNMSSAAAITFYAKPGLNLTVSPFAMGA